MKKVLLIAAGLSVISTPALAEDIASPTAVEKCFSAEGLVKFYEKMSSLKAARLDTLEPVMSAEWERLEEGPAFPKLWTRADGIDMPLTAQADGRIVGFDTRLKTMTKEAEICGEKIDEDEDNPKFNLSFDSDIMFKNRTGPYSLAELQDGVADGKSFYKKMFGGPLALLVPKMTHLTVQYLTKDTPLQLTFTQAGTAVAMPPYEKFGGTYVIALEDIEASGADTMTVSGGEFKLMPTPSVKKMKSLGFSEGEDEDESSDD